uniref:Protein Flattop n=1 Tax=Gasterosteus aculeatus aculeatus TaxID=481459 RepID=A0AAQ4QVU3_GASAC
QHINKEKEKTEGPTTFIADDRGHLLPGVKKRGNAWPDFKGTWDLPARIVPGRSAEGLRRLKSSAFEPQHSVCKNTGSLQDVGEHAMQVADSFVVFNALLNCRLVGCPLVVTGAPEGGEPVPPNNNTAQAQLLLHTFTRRHAPSGP